MSQKKVLVLPQNETIISRKIVARSFLKGSNGTKYKGRNHHSPQPPMVRDFNRFPAEKRLHPTWIDDAII
jgi:hypothetical protein